MFILGNFVAAIAHLLDILLNIYLWIVIIRAALSWVNPDPYNQIVRLLYQLTEPVMAPIRRLIPLRGAGIDFSPIVIMLLIIFLRSFLVSSLLQLSDYLH
jgi:YggT family protein